MENKQIGILTFHDSDNYGAVLQAYALQSYIYNNISSNVEILDYRKNLNANNVSSIFKGATHNPIKNVILNLLHFLQRNELKAIHEKFESFRNDYLKLSSKTYASEDDLRYCETKDYYITGSDQVFNPRLPDYRAYYLDFVNGRGKKVAYAPSFGISTFSDDVTKQIMPLLTDFDAVSCREDTGAKYLAKILGTYIPVVFDPVFLLSKEEWTKVAITPSEEKYLLVYCLSKGQSGKIDKLAKQIAKEENLKVITIGSTGVFSLKERIVVGPREFVGYINKADFVLTDSFHGTSFSLIFGKRHLSFIANKAKGTRIETIMNSFGKSQEIIYDIDNYHFISDAIKSPHIIPNNDLNASKEYLKKHLNG